MTINKMALGSFFPLQRDSPRKHIPIGGHRLKYLEIKSLLCIGLYSEAIWIFRWKVLFLLVCILKCRCEKTGEQMFLCRVSSSQHRFPSVRIRAKSIREHLIIHSYGLPLLTCYKTLLYLIEFPIMLRKLGMIKQFNRNICASIRSLNFFNI